MHILSFLGKKEATWNTISVFLSDGGAPQRRGAQKNFPLPLSMGLLLGYGRTAAANDLNVLRSQATLAELYDSSMMQQHHFNIFLVLLDIEASAYF